MQHSKKFHKTLLTSSGILKLIIVDTTKGEVDATGNTKVVVSNHALQCTAIAVGEAVKGHINYKGVNHENTFPGGVAPKAAATLYLVDHSNPKSTKMALEEVKNGNFDVLSISFGNLRSNKYKDEIQEILNTTSTVVVVAVGNYGNAAIPYPTKLICEPGFSDQRFISVGGLNFFNKPAGYSTDIKKYVTIRQVCEFYAPFSDSNDMSLKFTAGTSMSTPAVAGIICLLIQCRKKHKIDSLCKEEIISLLKNAIKDSEEEVGTYNDKFLKKAFNEKATFQSGCGKLVEL